MSTAAQPIRWNLPRTLEWIGDAEGVLRLIDQTRLPAAEVYVDCGTVEQVWEAIKVLRVRGAPAIGVAAAYGLCLGTRGERGRPIGEFRARVDEIANYLISARPTAVNLAWAVRRIAAVAAAEGERGGRGEKGGRDGGDDTGGKGESGVRRPGGETAATVWARMLDAARTLAREDEETCRRIGEVGADLVPEGGGVLTHCNAGALATVAYGTALALLYVAAQRGRNFRVFADETRPLLQGARLTAYELSRAGLDVTVICDGMAASLMRAGRVQLVVVGADRIAANGDVANKIGTYSVAVAARHHGVPFYVAAPRSTFDLSVADGAAIPIEERSEDEVRSGSGVATVPAGVRCYNPAFDVTPAGLVTGIVTEVGLVQPVTAERIAAIFRPRACKG